MASFKDIIASH